MGLGRQSSNESAVHGAPGAERADALGEIGSGTEASPSSGQGGSQKVVVLYGRRLQARQPETLATSELTIDLNAAIDCLRLVRGDLDVHYWARRGQGETEKSERFQISLWIRQLGDRTAALEGVLMHLGAPAVVLSGLGPAQCEALRDATKALECWLAEEESFQDVLRSVTAILHAADTICLGAAAGRPADRAAPPG